MYNSDGSDAENNDDDTDHEVNLTPEQIKIKEILERKGNQVVMGLLDCLSSKNQDNLEKTLTANSVLQEFCENDQSFALLTTSDALQRLI